MPENVRSIAYVTLATSLACAAAACTSRQIPLPPLAPTTIGDTTRLVSRGEYIVRSVAICGHCHAANPQQDPDGPLSGGFAFRNWRFGTIRASNLTPDSLTGLGLWSEAQIVRAIRNGQRRDGNVLVPIVPYEWFHNMSDRDALAVARYLMSQPPVRDEVRRSPNLIFRLATFLLIGPDVSRVTAAPARAPTAAYGGYLAHHVALCADCHTPRGGLENKPDLDRLFAGDATPPAGFPANPSNLTPDVDTGIGRWSEADFLRTMRTGVDPEGRDIHPFMPWRQLRRMTDDDLRAIYRYLRALPPIRNEVPRRPRENSGNEGTNVLRARVRSARLMAQPWIGLRHSSVSSPSNVGKARRRPLARIAIFGYFI